MATVNPFFCVRPCAEKARLVAALPYDVYSSEEAREFVASHPQSFLAIDRAETAFLGEVDMYSPEVYEKAGSLLQERIADGTFIRDGARCYYLYELTMDGRAQTGIVACVSIDDYINGVVKKHENTRADKEEDRVRHVKACRAQTGPIFLAYRTDKKISDITASVRQGTPLYDFVSEDGIGHRVFRIAEEETIAALQSAFAAINQIYIADGHHRAASAVRAGLDCRKEAGNYSGEEEFNYFLSVLFPENELKIMDYNRVVRDLNGLTGEEFLQKMCELFDVTPLAGQTAPAKKGEFTMFFGERWYRCSMKNENISDPVESLDVSLLQKLLLSPVLGIQDPRTDKRIDFVGGIRGLTELERRCHTDCKVAFAMYPTSISELFCVADAGLLMPPKSTWFEPKLRSGLFIHEI